MDTTPTPEFMDSLLASRISPEATLAEVREIMSELFVGGSEADKDECAAIVLKHGAFEGMRIIRAAGEDGPRMMPGS